MKPRAVHTVSSLFLIGALLFAQVAVNFFHRNHDVHQIKSVSAPLKNGAAGVQKHDEHCKVCAIDFFNHAFVPAKALAFNLSDFNLHHAPCDSGMERISISLSRGRAPPASVL